MQSTSQVAQLVQQLYLPTNSPDEIKSLQSRLQEIQTSCSWEVADQLFESHDQNVRFFAALTFTVKINQAGISLDEDTLNVLLQKLLSRFVRLVQQKESSLVLRKLCSTLVTYFILPNARWTLCLRHTLCCLHEHSFMDEASTRTLPDTSELMKYADAKTKSIILMLATTLAEDAIRIDHSSEKFDYCHQRVVSNLEDAVAIMTNEFDLLITDGNANQVELLQCYLSWMKYAGEENYISNDAIPRLKKLLIPTIQCLTSEQTLEPAAQFFIDLFTGSEVHLEQDFINELCRVLTSEWALQHVSNIEREQLDGDSIVVAQLIFSFGQAIPRLLKGSSQIYVSLMEIMHRLTRSQTYESIDQILCNTSIDFWETYCSAIPSQRDDQKSYDDFKRAEANWLQAIDELVSAAALPLDVNRELQRLGSDDVFAEFRSRAQSAVESSHMEFGNTIVEKLVAIVSDFDQSFSSSTPSSHLLGRLEFALYCIAGLSDSLENSNEDSEQTTSDAGILGHLIQSQTFASLTNFDISCPEKLRKRAISVIGALRAFFQNRTAQLMSAFEFLFQALEYPGYHLTSARAINLLAENHRKTLAPMVEKFLAALEQLILSSHVDYVAKEYLVASVAGIAQATVDYNIRYNSLIRICNCIQKSMGPLLNHGLDKSELLKQRQILSLKAMGYLKALGKASQTPDSQTISLDDDGDDEGSGADRLPSSMLTEIQSRLVKFMEMILEPHRNDGPLLVATCDVFRTGYRELSPGPFTFDAEVTADFITATLLSNPCLDTAVLTGASFLNSQTAKRDTSTSSVLRLLKFICDVIEKVKSPDVDPDLSYACLEFLCCTAQGHINRLKEVPENYTTMLLSFSIQCIECANVPPKKSAAQLWRIVFDMFSQSRDFLGGVIAAAGPHLTRALVQCFGGNAARSELSWLAEPFRKMVFTQPMAKSWIEQALFSESFPSSRVSDAEKRKFLAQVIHLRGDRRTQNVVKDFWLLCRGTPAGYG